MRPADAMRLSGDAIEDDRVLPLHVIPAAERCTRIVYTTKIEWLARVTDGFTRAPADVAALWKYGPIGESHRDVLRAVTGSLGGTIHFVGDLDPLDLMTYETLSEAMKPVAGVTYLGISDAWLELCERDLALRSTSIDALCIPLTPGEQDVLADLTRPPAWINPAGARASSLLARGLKLELEGASNPNLYSGAFQDDLRRLLFG